MIEFGIQRMPAEVTTFCVVACTDHLGFAHVNAGFAKCLLAIITTGYPDRLGALYAGPVNMALDVTFQLLKPLMPPRLAAKIHLMTKPLHQLGVAIGADQVPVCFGGIAKHDFGSGECVFDWDRMAAGMAGSPRSAASSI